MVSFRLTASLAGNFHQLSRCTQLQFLGPITAHHPIGILEISLLAARCAVTPDLRQLQPEMVLKGQPNRLPVRGRGFHGHILDILLLAPLR
jgi:hypothetical protein